MKTPREAGRDARSLWRFCVVDDSLDESRARQVVDQMIASTRTGAGAVLLRFLRLLKLDRDRWTARVESAAPLDPDARTEIQKGLTHRYGRTIATAFVVNPTLIGGMRVKIGSDVYDGTVRAGLDALEARF